MSFILVTLVILGISVYGSYYNLLRGNNTIGIAFFFIVVVCCLVLFKAVVEIDESDKDYDMRKRMKARAKKRKRD